MSGDDDDGVSGDDDGVSDDDVVSSEESGVSSDGEEVVDLARLCMRRGMGSTACGLGWMGL